MGKRISINLSEEESVYRSEQSGANYVLFTGMFISTCEVFCCQCYVGEGIERTNRIQIYFPKEMDELTTIAIRVWPVSYNSDYTEFYLTSKTGA